MLQKEMQGSFVLHTAVLGTYLVSWLACSGGAVLRVAIYYTWYIGHLLKDALGKNPGNMRMG